jgi:hypothetical protein
MHRTAEHERLKAAPGVSWKRWGPYLSERQWGTVREDYSATGDAWEYFPHDHARSRAYRWGEDGIAGFSDDNQHLCLALALWNGRDPILKERLFGLTNAEGNHGEDVKELYWYLDATPSHAYLKMLYKYPQGEFPYARIIEENRKAGVGAPEFELLDTGILDGDRYFDVFVEYAQGAPGDILMRVSAWNRAPERAVLHVLPQLWFRNTWSWGLGPSKPYLFLTTGVNPTIEARHEALGTLFFHSELTPRDTLFTENETNWARLLDNPARGGYYKDAFHERVIRGDQGAVNPRREGTKGAVWHELSIPAGGCAQLRFRLTTSALRAPFGDFDALFATRIREADQFYDTLRPDSDGDDARRIQRQAFAGMIWSKQFYYFDIPQWLAGDPGHPPPPRERRRNRDWAHLNNADIISMPDKWEYPWYASWDLAFHCLVFAHLDPQFAKDQLVLLTREWYMHPNGQLPAYEWTFGDVNPPVHAWASWRVFQIDRRASGSKTGDLPFLERVLHKLLINFTWWVNRKDIDGRNVFQGGFLGLDNIGVFDRSSALPTGGRIDQADATSWMAMYALNLMRISLELAQYNHVYEDIATKFLEHFLQIAQAMAHIGSSDMRPGSGVGLWDGEDQFFYDVLHLPDGSMTPLKVRSIVGLIPLFAVETLEPELLEKLPDFSRRLEWYLAYRPDLAALVSHWEVAGRGSRRLLSLLRENRTRQVLRRMLDETEFLSPYGVRALSKNHEAEPFFYRLDGMDLSVAYRPAESDGRQFGGNSNWRGPVWFPVNFLIIESLQKFHHYYGDDFQVECPTGSGQFMTLEEVARELAARLTRLFLRGANGLRPVFGDSVRMQTDPHYRDYVLFYEYFHGDTGRGAGASHQTGWTGLIAKLLLPRHRS